MRELPFPLEPVSAAQSPPISVANMGMVLFAVFSVIVGSAAITVGGYLVWKWQQQPLDPIVCSEGESVAQLYVDVGGSVVNPGLYAVPLGSRVGDVIAEAGGIASSADPQFVQLSLNLSDVVKDGQKLYVPSQAERKQLATVAASTENDGEEEATTAQSFTTSINSASAKELQALPGIGEKRAADIIAGRPFSTLRELVERKILTNSLLTELESLISL